mmetsp:Transcript_5524/g.8412  ORF Transcript_5524/g.8412 Transcript_5524/m.8412 type:complete len:81 (+) Transcript_5524:178-420(+)
MQENVSNMETTDKALGSVYCLAYITTRFDSCIARKCLVINMLSRLGTGLQREELHCLEAYVTHLNGVTGVSSSLLLLDWF